MLGTTDGYNTENTECLHIDLAKNLYCVTNKKAYILEMTEALQWNEEFYDFESNI